MAAVHYNYSNSFQPSVVGQIQSSPLYEYLNRPNDAPIPTPQSNCKLGKRGRDDHEASLFRCEPCDLALDSQMALQAHTNSHIVCSQCSFSAAPKIVKAHFESAHGRFAGSGFKTVTVAVPGCPVQHFRICVGNNAEDVKQWKAERRRRFPRQKVEAREEEIVKHGPAGLTNLLEGYGSSSDEEDCDMEESKQNDVAVNKSLVATNPEATKESVSFKRVCRFFARTGTCRNGDKCTFQHDANASKPVVVRTQTKDRSKETLLGKLLVNDVSRERRLTLQLLEYIVRSDFLKKKA